jgi:hypothetical protein
MWLRVKQDRYGCGNNGHNPFSSPRTGDRIVVSFAATHLVLFLALMYGSTVRRKRAIQVVGSGLASMYPAFD